MKKKRFIVEVPEVFHNEVKGKASKSGTTLSDYIIKAVVKKMREEECKNKKI